MLTALRAEVEQDCDCGELTRELYQSLREPTADVLRQTLTHIRDSTRYWGVEVRSTIYLAVYRDSAGRVYKRPFSFWATTETGLLMDGLEINPLTAAEWQNVTTRVEEDQRTSPAKIGFSRPARLWTRVV